MNISRLLQIVTCTPYVQGVSLLVGVAVIWVGASHLIKSIFSSEFDRPFFLTYFNTCGFAFYLFGGCCKREWREVMCPPAPVVEEVTSPVEDDAPLLPPTPPATWREYRDLAVLFAPLWMAANYSFHLSLREATVASNSVLSNTSSLWTMLLCVICFGETVNVHKVLSIFLTLGGVLLVALSPPYLEADESSTAPVESTRGAILALISAMCYAVYTVVLRAYVKDHIIMPVFFGFVGVVVLVCGVPLLFMMDFFGFEQFSFPRKEVMGYLLLNALVGTNISDVMWARAVVLTSPVVATLALSLTIPIGMLSDVVLNGASYSPTYVTGSLCVLLGFLLVNLAFSAEDFFKLRQEVPAPQPDDELESSDELEMSVVSFRSPQGRASKAKVSF